MGVFFFTDTIGQRFQPKGGWVVGGWGEEEGEGRETGAKDVGGGREGLKKFRLQQREGGGSLPQSGMGGSNFPKRIHLKETGGARRGRGGNLTAEERRISSVHSNLCDKEKGGGVLEGQTNNNKKGCYLKDSDERQINMSCLQGGCSKAPACQPAALTHAFDRYYE